MIFVKILVVYYSLSGNTRLIAEKIAEKINVTLLEIKPKKEIEDKATKYMWGGMQVTMKQKPELLPFSVNPLDFDLIFIGTPIWAWRQSAPISSFISQVDLKGKKVAIWMCGAGVRSEKTMNRFKKALEGVDIIDSIGFQEPLSNQTEEQVKNAQAWAEKVVNSIK